MGRWAPHKRGQRNVTDDSWQGTTAIGEGKGILELARVPLSNFGRESRRGIPLPPLSPYIAKASQQLRFNSRVRLLYPGFFSSYLADEIDFCTKYQTGFSAQESHNPAKPRACHCGGN